MRTAYLFQIKLLELPEYAFTSSKARTIAIKRARTSLRKLGLVEGLDYSIEIAEGQYQPKTTFKILRGGK